jgi:hypothetical protein
VAILGDALEFRCLKLAAVQRRPECAIFGGVALVGGHEHRMVLALDLVEPIPEEVEKILVGGDDRAIHVEFDDGLRSAYRCELGLSVSIGLADEHQSSPCKKLPAHRTAPFGGGSMTSNRTTLAL